MTNVFSKEWFHQPEVQSKLLWLVNAPVVRVWFRYLLRINGKRSSVGTRNVLRVDPNAITWLEKNEDGKPYFSTEFRTHDKFSKRLYYGLYPLWWAFHAWDMVVANRLKPEWNLGFDTLGPVFPDAHPETNSVDGYVERSGVDEALATIIAGAGTNSVDDLAIDGISAFLQASTTTNQYQTLQRGITLFDTSALTSSAVVSAAVYTLVGVSGNKFNQLGDPDLVITECSTSAVNSLTGSDFNVANWGSVELATRPTYAGWSTGDNDITLNSSGLDAISLTAQTKLGVRLSFDFDGSGATWGSGQQAYLQARGAETSGTGNDPALTVTYTIVESGATNMLLMGIG